MHSIFLLHPVWKKYRVSSIGSHLLWIFVSWVFWMAGAAALNGALPALLAHGVCEDDYCTQLQALFGMRTSKLVPQS
jgi:hypothetical protein